MSGYEYLSIDPVGFKLSDPMTFNRYSYVGNNPNSYVDPNGEERFGVNGGVTGALGIGLSVNVEASFDTTHNEFSVQITGGVVAGAKAGANIEGFKEPSSAKPTGTSVEANGTLKVEAAVEVQVLGTGVSANAEASVTNGASSNGGLKGNTGDADGSVSGSRGLVSTDSNGRSSIGVGGSAGVSATYEFDIGGTINFTGDEEVGDEEVSDKETNGDS